MSLCCIKIYFNIVISNVNFDNIIDDYILISDFIDIIVAYNSTINLKKYLSDMILLNE